jgi:hypothetical protein
MRIQNSVVRIIIAVASIAFLQFSCSKDKFTTRPQLKFKSVNNYTIDRGDLIIFNLEFTDKEGDVSDTLYFQNRTANCPASDYGAPASYKIAEFPTTADIKAELEITFENGTNNTGNVIYSGNRCLKPDTTYFYFWMKDKANNVSDTVRTDKPLIILN